MIDLLPSVRHMIFGLSQMQREFLIDHVEGLCPFTSSDPMINRTRESLLKRKLIRYEPPVRNRLGRPDGTVLTDAGRKAMCVILGQYADDLVRALEKDTEVIEDRLLEALKRSVAQDSSKPEC